MSRISGINSSLNVSYQQLSSGKRINSAADDAAGLAIVEKQNAQINGYNAGTRNMQMGKNLLNVSDAALSGITDYLQQIRELAVQASNSAIYSSEDTASIQQQIDQYKQGINDIASQTQFNNQNILDGGNQNFQMATNGNGGSTTISTGNSTLKALGIEDFDVTGSFDMNQIDKALDYVSSLRSKGGAQSNALDYAMNYNSYAAYNTTASSSKLEDLDYPQAISDLKKNQLLRTYSIMMQKKQQEQEQNSFRRMFM